MLFTASEIFAALLLGFSLALDCFAISISQGIRTSAVRPLVTLALLFGLFQGGMLLLGHLAGDWLSALLAGGMYWLAAALLFAIGIKMLLESRETDAGDAPEAALPLNRVGDYLLLSIATSIDALAAGVTLGSLEIPVWLATGVVGFFSLLLALLGGHFGKRLGEQFGKRAELFGGLVLIALGVKSLLG